MARKNSTRDDKRAITKTHTREDHASRSPAADHLRKESYPGNDWHTGTKTALIAAGIASDGQFPGDPGRGSTSCSYRKDGSPVHQGMHARESVLRIMRYGKKFQARVLVDEAEQKRRRALDAENKPCKTAAEGRCGVWIDLGMDDVQERAAHSPARFKLGEVALYFYKNDEDEYGEKVRIVGDYKMRRVAQEDGHYVDDTGAQFEYKPGYSIMLMSDPGSSFFSPAHQLTRDDCTPSHMCLVASRPAAAF